MKIKIRSTKKKKKGKKTKSKNPIEKKRNSQIHLMLNKLKYQDKTKVFC